MKKIIICLFLSVGLSGCHIYRAYERPDEVVADSLYRQSVAAEDTVSLASLSWKELFTDPQLQQLIDIGIRNNTDLNIARLRVEEAEALLLSSKLAYLPSVSLTPQGTMSSAGGTKTSKTYNLAASADWELDIFGKVTTAKRRAKAAYEQSKEYEQAVKTQLVASVANTYYTLLMLDSQYEIAVATEAAWKESVNATRAMKKAGMMTEAGLAQTEATYYNICTAVLDLKEQINQTENSMALLLAETPHKIQRGKLENQQLPEDFSVGIPLQMLSNRPDVRSAEFSLAQAFYTTNAARAAFYPSITLSGSAGWTNSAGSMIINPGKFVASAVASLTQPLFNKGVNIAQLKIAKAQQEEARLSFEQTLLNAGVEVNEALVQYQTAREKSAFYDKQITSLQTAARSTSLLMEHSNNTTYLEVLTAQQTLLNARLSQVANRFTEIQGVITLYQALGGGRM